MIASKKDLSERAIDNSTGQEERNVILRTTVYVDEGMVYPYYFSCELNEVNYPTTNKYT